MAENKMMPIGPLMIEHRMIERMIAVMKEALQSFREEGDCDHSLIEEIVDFIRMYADRCHHGKEEDILFRDAGKKDLPSEIKQTMDKLIEEHAWARDVTKNLAEANEKHRSGEGSLEDVTECMQKLIDFYPGHIDTEDHHFFLPLMDHFSQEEQDEMLGEEYEFDRKLIHEKYDLVVSRQEDRYGIDDS